MKENKSRYLSKHDLVGLVDEFYLSNTNDLYEVVEFFPSDLNLINRLDIFIKLNSIESIQLNALDSYAVELYKSHIAAMTDGKNCEPGNIDKNNIDKFILHFKKIITSLHSDEFNSELSIIPINEEFVPLNGAHRLAAALYFNKKVTCVICKNTVMPKYDFHFFEAFGFDINDLFSFIVTMQEYQKQLITAVAWPSIDIDLSSFFDTILIEKELKLSPQGVKNFVVNTYLNEEWLGTPKNNFAGASSKSEPCTGKGNLKVFIFYNQKKQDLIELKESIRSVFNFGKHSIHICDDTNDSVPLSKFSFNPNIEVVLNNISNYRFNEYITKLINLSEKFKKMNDKFILSGSAILGLLSLREPNDIDYISLQSLSLDTMDYHGEKLSTKYLQLSTDPYKHFYYFGLRFMSIDETINFKKRRGEIKDFTDIQLLEGYSTPSFLNRLKSKFLISYKIKKLALKRLIKNILDALKLLDVAKKLYRKVKK